MIVLTLTLVSPVIADQAGGSAARFLLLGPGARPAAMGNAFTAVADDVHSLYWNPAGLASCNRGAVQLMHGEWFADIDYDYLGYVHQHQLFGGRVGANLAMVDYGSINVTQINGQTAITGLGTASARDFALGISYGHSAELVDYGITLKYIEERLESYKAVAFAMDLGVKLNNPPGENFELAATVMNLGTKMRYIRESDDLPLTFKLGASFRPARGKLLLASDLVFTNDDKLNCGLGAEYQIAEMFALRLGYNTENDAGSGITAGLGFDSGRGLIVDYACVPYGELGSTHRISLDYEFGPIEQPEPPPLRQQTTEPTAYYYTPAVENAQPPTAEATRVPAPPTVNELIAAGNNYYLYEDYDQALGYYNAALAQEPQNFTALYNTATIYYLKGDYPAAASYYNSFCRHFPDQTDGHLYLGACYEKLGMIDRAVAEWRIILQYDADNMMAQTLLSKYGE